MNCMKLSAYQCQTSVIIGRSKKLIEVSNKNRVITILGPCLSITLPTKGPTNSPKAEKDKDMLIWVRVHPYSSVKAVLNRENVYVPNPSKTVAALKQTDTDHHPFDGLKGLKGDVSFL